MTLPTKPMPTRTIDIDGQALDVRGLSRTEAMHFTTGFTPDAMPDTLVGARADLAETYLVSKGTGVTEDEAAAWRDSTDSEAVGLVVDTVLELSALIKSGESDPKALSSDTSAS